jgi:bisphosphoglycerate-independent phosphoglycerate mutase (AlkP superfamily)
MRLKKKDIVEMVNNPEAKLPNPGELKSASQNVQNLTKDIEKLSAAMEDNMGSAFITKEDENKDEKKEDDANPSD